MAHPLTAADKEIARLQAAHDAACQAETAAYTRYIGLPFGVADEAAEQEWQAAQAVTRQAHEDLLAAIDARRDGTTHSSILSANPLPCDTLEAATWK